MTLSGCIHIRPCDIQFSTLQAVISFRRNESSKLMLDVGEDGWELQEDELGREAEERRLYGLRYCFWWLTDFLRQGSIRDKE